MPHMTFPHRWGKDKHIRSRRRPTRGAAPRWARRRGREEAGIRRSWPIVVLRSEPLSRGIAHCLRPRLEAWAQVAFQVRPRAKAHLDFSAGWVCQIPEIVPGGAVPEFRPEGGAQDSG